MNQRPPLLERAYELARSGKVATVDRLIRALSAEGYELVESHLQGGTQLRRELQQVCRAAWVEAGNEPEYRGRRPA